MNDFDIEKLIPKSPSNGYEAVDLYLATHNKLVEAIIILDIVDKYPDEIFNNSILKRINLFLNQYRKVQNGNNPRATTIHPDNDSHRD